MEKNSRQYSAARPENFSKENKDCVVRAFSVVLGRSYEEIHAACKMHGRKSGCGTTGHTQELVAEEYDMKKVPLSVLTCGTQFNPTLQQFINAHPRGRYYLTRRGHAFAVIDGVVHDWMRGTGARSRIIRAYQVV
jgi:hypothetical protein